MWTMTYGDLKVLHEDQFYLSRLLARGHLVIIMHNKLDHKSSNTQCELMSVTHLGQSVFECFAIKLV